MVFFNSSKCIAIAKSIHKMHVTIFHVGKHKRLSRGGPVAWPLRSPDLTLLDYYLWGHMKMLVYETKVESRAALRDRIFAAAEHIRNHPDND